MKDSAYQPDASMALANSGAPRSQAANHFKASHIPFCTGLAVLAALAFMPTA